MILPLGKTVIISLIGTVEVTATTGLPEPFGDPRGGISFPSPGVHTYQLGRTESEIYHLSQWLISNTRSPPGDRRLLFVQPEKAHAAALSIIEYKQHSQKVSSLTK